MPLQRTQFEALGSEVYHVLAEEIARRIEKCGDSMPIITGMFDEPVDTCRLILNRWV